MRWWIVLVIALVAVAAAKLVFSYRITIAGGKYLITVLVIAVIAFLLWKRQGPRE